MSVEIKHHASIFLIVKHAVSPGCILDMEGLFTDDKVINHQYIQPGGEEAAQGVNG